jgi:hypothetical protein
MLSVFNRRAGTLWLWLEFALVAPRVSFSSAYLQVRSWRHSLLLAYLMAVFGVSLLLSGNIRARGHDLTAFLWHVLWPSSRSSSTLASTFLAYIKIVLGLMRFSLVVFLGASSPLCRFNNKDFFCVYYKYRRATSKKPTSAKTAHPVETLLSYNIT